MNATFRVKLNRSGAVPAVVIYSVVLAILCALLVGITCWTPYRVRNVSRIDVGYHGGRRYLIASSAHFDDYEKALRHTLNGATLSLFSTVDMDVECSDQYVSAYRNTLDVWVEFYMTEGKYERMFFGLDESLDHQFVVVFATPTNSYDDGEFLGYRNCNCKRLLNTIREYSVESNG